MSNPWPERQMAIAETERDLIKIPEGDNLYLIRMVQQLFVEIAQVKAMLEKSLLSQQNLLPVQTLDRLSTDTLRRFSNVGRRIDDGDVNDHDVKRPSTRSLKERWLPGEICFLCGIEMGQYQASWDHLIPRSRGGVDAQSNRRMVHKSCNFIKGDRTLEELKTDFEAALAAWRAGRTLPGMKPKHIQKIQLICREQGWDQVAPTRFLSVLYRDTQFDPKYRARLSRNGQRPFQISFKASFDFPRMTLDGSSFWRGHGRQARLAFYLGRKSPDL